MNEYDLKYPKSDGLNSDRSVAFNKDDPDLFKILTYWGYSTKTEEYYAIERTWKFVKEEERIQLHLESVALKYPNVSWFTLTETPKIHISDMHLRLARAQYRIRTEKHRCDFLILSPSRRTEIET